MAIVSHEYLKSVFEAYVRSHPETADVANDLWKHIMLNAIEKFVSDRALLQTAKSRIYTEEETRLNHMNMMEYAMSPPLSAKEVEEITLTNLQRLLNSKV